VDKLRRISDNRPLLFALLTTLAWVLAGGAFAGLGALVLGVPLGGTAPQVLGTVSATACLLAVAWRLGWMGPAGIASVGGWRAWLAGLVALAYLVVAYWYAFFGDISFDPAFLTRSEAARSVVWRQILVGAVEEILFRGVLLYVLVRVWGRTARGILASAFATAALFGVLHLLQVLAGSSLELALAVVLECVVSGIWWAAIALRWRSIWPVAAIHAISNMAVLIKALSIPGLALPVSGYVVASLLELPLVILGVWVLVRLAPRPVIPDTA
jgi:membrane protease YdiL (CAAX protease family)